LPQPQLADIPEDVQRRIQSRLDEIERDQSIRIVLAVASGSRAWGFASEKSDFDVRFIFVRQHLDYLAVREHSDVMVFPRRDMIELSGWDLRHALRRGLLGDPGLLDRLTSPIVYRELGWEAAALRNLFVHMGDPKALLRHYVGIAHWRCRTDLEDRKHFNLQRYFRVIRPALALLWLQQRPGEMPPLSLPALMQGVVLPDDVLQAVSMLLERRPLPRKAKASERIAVLEEFCLAQVGWGREALGSASSFPSDEMREEAARIFVKSVLGDSGS
jgi:predicted nucleotidyltransferase